MFELKWEKRALQELSKFDRSSSSRIYKKVGELRQGFKSKDIKRLKGSSNFRLRVGDYRVLFSFSGSELIVWKVGHRKKIYQR